MPYYDYLCTEGHETEVTQRITEDAFTACPREDCSAAAKKLISRTSFQLKGNGWFSNGYSGASNVGPSTKASRAKAKADRVAPKKK